MARILEARIESRVDDAARRVAETFFGPLDSLQKDLAGRSDKRVLGKFLAAARTGDRKAVMALLAEEVEYMTDGGGKVVAALRVLRGQQRIGRLYDCIARRFIGLGYRLIRVNGELAAVAMMDGRVFSVLSFVIDGQSIAGIYNVRNPDKLAEVVLRDLAV